MELNQGKYARNYLNSCAQTELMKWINPNAEAILDLGCGDGGTTDVISGIVGRTIYGLTANEEEVNSYNGDNKLVYGDAHNLPWQNGFFDFVYARHILEHCKNPSQVILELNRVIKLGGELVVCVPSIEKEWVLTYPDHFSVLPDLAWKKLFQENGFEIMKYEEGKWLAAITQEDELEYRYLLRKKMDMATGSEHREVYRPQNGQMSNPLAAVAECDVAIFVHNLVVYETIKPIVEVLVEENISFELIIPSVNYDESAQKLFDETYSIIYDNYPNHTIRLENGNNKYYTMAIYSFLPFYVEVASKYRVRIQYGMGKPEYNFDLWSMNFDFILTMSNYDDKFLSSYTQTVLVGPIKYANFSFAKAKKCPERKRILYLPTYGELSQIENVVPLLADISKAYEIVIKLHHMTPYFEADRVAFIKRYFDESAVYDHKKPITELIEEADLIISDNSGAIFDGIISGKPTAILKNDDIGSFRGIKSEEKRLIESGVISILENNLSFHESIDRIFNHYDEIASRIVVERSNLFPVIGEKSKSIIRGYLKNLIADKVDLERYHFNRFIQSEVQNLEKKLKFKDNIANQLELDYGRQREELLTIIRDFKSRIDYLSNELNSYIKFDSEKASKIEENEKHYRTELDRLVRLCESEKLELSRQLADYVRFDSEKSVMIASQEVTIKKLEDFIAHLREEIDCAKERENQLNLVNAKLNQVYDEVAQVKEFSKKLGKKNFFERIIKKWIKRA